jgi:hypothetical protein
MASIINASSTGSGGIVQTADASGVLQLQSNGTNAVIVDASGYTTIGTAVPSATKAGNLNVAGTGTTGNGWAAQFGNATGSLAVLAGVRSGIASIGTQNALTLVMNPDGGQMRTPSQSAFLAYPSTSQTIGGTNTVIQFNTCTTPSGRNSAFNTSTYSYTAPETGLYWFNMILTNGSTAQTTGLISLNVNGGRYRDLYEGTPMPNSNQEWHSSTLAYLTAGDVVNVVGANVFVEGGANAASYYSMLQGYFIG